jgi:hypothetical protein
VIKYETFIIKTFDQLKKHNFDQVNFGQTTPCQKNIINIECGFFNVLLNNLDVLISECQ